MQLNYKILGQGHPLIILHGLLGSLDNWQSMAKAFSAQYKVYIVDQRNHGRSPHTPEMSYPLMAADLLEFMQQQGIERAHVLGHSMGGKTAIEFALHHAEKVDHLVIVDIAPKEYPRHHDTIFDALFSVDLKSIQRRADAEAILLQKIPDAAMAQFLMKGLDRMEEGSYAWKFNLEVLHSQYLNIIAGITPGPVVHIPTLVLRSGTSGYIQEQDIQLFRQYFTDVQMVTFENTGHWLHAEAAKEFFEAVSEFLVS